MVEATWQKPLATNIAPNGWLVSQLLLVKDLKHYMVNESINSQIDLLVQINMVLCGSVVQVTSHSPLE